MDYQRKEVLKQKVTVGGISFVAGAVAWWIVLASFIGWVSPTTAARTTSDAVQAKIDKVLAPLCADRFMANKAALAMFTKASEGYNRDTIVQKTVPKLGVTTVDYELSDGCANAVAARLKSAARKAAATATHKS